MYQERLADTLPYVRERIAEAAARGGRSGDRVRIVAVTKGHPAAAVEAVLEAGLPDLGENRLEELEEKQALFQDDPRPRWHMVGHLQRRTAPGVWGRVVLLHSLDSVRLAHRLERTAPEGEGALPVLLQVNTSGEEAKYGFTPGGFRESLDEILDLSTLRVEGLMTMAPLTDDQEVLRRTFRGLRKLHEEAKVSHSAYRGRELSMGMSNDYELAVEEGSTMVRLGTVLLGERER